MPGMLRRNFGAAGFIAAGATKLLGPLDHDKTIKLDALAGSIVTLPQALGKGLRISALVTVLATSNSHIIKVSRAADILQGIILGSRVDAGNAVLGFAAAADSDTITLNRTTTGSVTVGEWLEFYDVAAGLWHVKGVLTATGAAFATPFSAAV